MADSNGIKAHAAKIAGLTQSLVDAASVRSGKEIAENIAKILISDRDARATAAGAKPFNMHRVADELCSYKGASTEGVVQIDGDVSPQMLVDISNARLCHMRSIVGIMEGARENSIVSFDTAYNALIPAIEDIESLLDAASMKLRSAQATEQALL